MMTYFDGLVQERRNSNALAMELCLSCTNPSIYIVKMNCDLYKINAIVADDLAPVITRASATRALAQLHV